jgi:hypothetical protein
MVTNCYPGCGCADPLLYGQVYLVHLMRWPRESKKHPLDPVSIKITGHPTEQTPKAPGNRSADKGLRVSGTDRMDSCTCTNLHKKGDGSCSRVTSVLIPVLIPELKVGQCMLHKTLHKKTNRARYNYAGQKLL